MGHGIDADLNTDCSVDLADFAKLANDWMACNELNGPQSSECGILRESGIREYKASLAPSNVTVDGDLSEWPAFDWNESLWCQSHWYPINKVYYKDSFYTGGIQNAFLSLMYDADEDVIYGAVIVDDTSGKYGYENDWNTQDALEIFMQGNPNNDTPLNLQTNYANAQQLYIGLNSDLSSTWMRWGSGVTFDSANPGLQAVVSRTVVGNIDKIVYEFKVIPYNNYGGFDSSTTVVTDLTQGSNVGFDIVLDDCTADYDFGMWSPNLALGKYADVSKFSIITCE
jgi:hypothetical protein